MTTETPERAPAWITLPPHTEYAPLLKLARRFLGVTQQQAGQMCGINWVTFGRHERGETSIDTDSVRAYAKGLGLKVSFEDDGTIRAWLAQ